MMNQYASCALANQMGQGFPAWPVLTLTRNWYSARSSRSISANAISSPVLLRTKNGNGPPPCCWSTMLNSTPGGIPSAKVFGLSESWAPLFP